MTILVVAAVLAAFAFYVNLYVAYQTLLFATNALVRDPKPLPPSRRRHLNVVVPAHNEEMLLPRLLSALQAQDYPSDRYRVTVIADNCSDGTAAVSRTFNVQVLERSDPERRGKGFAIGWLVDSMDFNSTEAIVIVDGDSVVEPSFLSALNMQLDRGDKVIQCYNGVANADQSWFTRLMNVSRTISNEILHPAKRKLGLSSHLMGNGMCFTTRVIRTFGWNSFSVGEDWEYYSRLILSGEYVGYSRAARVYHQESMGLQQASSQRLRWSGSRFQMLRLYGTKLLARGIKKRSIRSIDAALPLVFPNPSLAINLTMVGLFGAAGFGFLSNLWSLFAWFSSLVIAQLLMFCVGVLYTANKMNSALSLFMAPAFLLWKLVIDVLSLAGAGTKQWKPTERKL